MPDWKALALARGLTLSGKELDALVQPLEALDAVFRPLLEELPPELDPAPVFSPGEQPE